MRSILKRGVLRELVDKYGDAEEAGVLRRGAVATLLIYTDEAHAVDEWPITSARDAAPCKPAAPVMIKAHRTPEERVAAAEMLLSDFSVPPGAVCFADAMQRGWTPLDPQDAAYARALKGGHAPGEPELLESVNFMNAYACWPFRYYLLELLPGGAPGAEPVRVRHVAFPDGDKFHIKDLYDAVDDAAMTVESYAATHEARSPITALATCGPRSLQTCA